MIKRIILVISFCGIFPAGCNILSTTPYLTPSAITEIGLTNDSMATPDISPPSNLSNQDELSKEIFKKGLIVGQQHILEELDKISTYVIHIHISQDLSNLSGSQAVHYTNNENQSLNEIYFRLFPNVNGGKMSVSNVMINDKSSEPMYEFGESAIRLSLHTPLPPGTSVDISMDFTILIPRIMGGNYGLFGYFDKILVLDEFYPSIPVYDDKGWNVEKPPLNGDLTYMDVSNYIVQMTAPEKLIFAATGNEIERRENGDEQVVTFEAGPARDFYLAASEQLISYSDTLGETIVTSYAPQEYDKSAQFALQVAINALISYNRRFGQYPYTEFDVVSTPMKALGIEYPGIVGIGLSMYETDTRFSGSPSTAILESVIAHESGHQWFYSLIGNDQVDEPWLDESVTQFVTGLYYLDTYGPAAEADYQRSWYDRWDRISKIAIPIGLPSYEYAENEYSPIIYGRGPIFLKSMADQIDREVFDESLKYYAQTNAWRIGNVNSFKQITENHCRCDLTDLFQEWLYSPLIPSYLPYSSIIPIV